jgi:hypothetical protein
MAEQGMSVRDIAVQLGRSKSAVHRLLRIVGNAECGTRNAELGAEAVESSEEGPPEGGTQNEPERLREAYLNQRGGSSSISCNIVSAVGDPDDGHRDDPANSVEVGPNPPEFVPGSPPLTHMVTPLGRDVWVETFDTLGRPGVWYSCDSKGRKFKHTRGHYGVYVKHLNEAAVESSR